MGYQVKQAVIMAAGLSSRFAPISYEQPKALIRVRDEVLIERQIRQLKEAGIERITIVTGYQAEQFAYLKEKFQVELVYNDQYKERNNHYSLYLVKDRLENCYICSADNYFIENPFEKEVEDAYYATVYVEGETNEWCISYDENHDIQDVSVGGKDAWVMLGHVFFSEPFANAFVPILEAEMKKEETKKLLWESIYIKHLDQLKMKLRQYSNDRIYEFDSLDELRMFDPAYKKKTHSKIMETLANRLTCEEGEITQIVPFLGEDGAVLGMEFQCRESQYRYLYETKELIPLIFSSDVKQIQSLQQQLFPEQEIQTIKRLGGLTNHSYAVALTKGTYVFRIPGEGTETLIDRLAERVSTMLASRLNIDSPVLYFDTKGRKVTKWIPNAKTMNADTLKEESNIKRVATVFHTLHTCKEDTNVIFDLKAMAEAYEQFILDNDGQMYEDFDEVRKQVYQLFEVYQAKKEEYVPCHNDPLCENWILSDDTMYLIDWEYAGMNDPMWDLADVSIEASYNEKEDQLLLETYQQGYDETMYERFMANKVYIDYLWSLWGKTRVPFDALMEEYAKLRYDRLKENLRYFEAMEKN